MKTGIISRMLAVAVAALTICTAAGAVENESTELFVGFNAMAPARGEDWEDASGMELQGRFWQNDHVGLALSIGSDVWNAKTVVSEIDEGGVYSYTAISGDATVTTLGASLLYRSEAMFIELGLRYGLVDSSVYAEAVYEDRSGRDYRYDVIDIDNTTFFIARMGFELELTDEVFLVPSIGYQVDLSKPDERFAGESLGETDLRAVTFGLGITCRF